MKMVVTAQLIEYNRHTEAIGIAMGASSRKEAPIVQKTDRSKINVPIAVGMVTTGTGVLYSAVSLLGVNMMSKNGAITLLIIAAFFLLLLSSISSTNASRGGR